MDSGEIVYSVVEEIIGKTGKFFKLVSSLTPLAIELEPSL